MAQDVGTGTTIAFATSAFVAKILKVNGKSIERADVDTTHLGTTLYKTNMPGDLVDPGEAELDIAFEPHAAASRPPIDGLPENVTITFPMLAGGAVAAKVVSSGWIKAWEWGVAIEERMTAKATVRFTGAPTWTNAS